MLGKVETCLSVPTKTSKHINGKQYFFSFHAYKYKTINFIVSDTFQDRISNILTQCSPLCIQN